MEEKILDDIKELLLDDYPNIEITMDTMLEYDSVSGLNMSSLEIVQFIVDLEEKYDIIIDIEDRYYTVGDAVRSIVGYLVEKNKTESEEKSEFKL